MDAARVRVVDGRATPVAPRLSDPADGLVLVPEGTEGLPAGAAVLVHPLP